MTARTSDRSYQVRTALIILAAACIYLLGNGRVSLWDRDEAWYAQTSRQMLGTGDWVIPHFLDTVRTAKPILIYWCQVVSMKFFGDNEFGARLPSAVAMTITLVMLAVVLSKALGARRAMYTVLVFTTNGLVLVMAKMSIIDSVQLTFATGAQICLYALYRAGHAGARHASLPPKRSSAWIAAVFWGCVGVTGLAKGPFMLIVLLASVVALALLDVGRQYRSWTAWKRATSWWRLLRPLWGLPLALAIVAPWLITAYVRDPHFVTALLHEPGRHAGTNQSGQWPWPGYFLAAIWVTFFPWCLLLPGALVLAWKHRATPQIRFALGLILGNWVIVEMMTTKLPHYLLPAYAALAFITATALIRCMRSQYLELHKKGFFILAGVWACGALFMSNIPWMFGIYHRHYSMPAAAALTVAGAAYAALVIGFFWYRRLAAAAATMGLGMFLIVGLLYGMYLPTAQFLRLPARVGAELRSRGLTEPGQVMMVGYREPSLGFYQGGTIKDVEDRRYLFDVAPAQWPQWIVTTSGLFKDLPPDRQRLLQVVSTHRGINYNTGCRTVDVLILRKREAP